MLHYRPHRFSVAPMMDWTDRHCRYFHRLMSRHARLYTEMLTTGAVIHGDRARLLDFDAAEHPVAIQLGGSDPAALAEAARIAEQWGYDEVNLNCGCPSDRVQSGSFGACLMREPDLVAHCVAAMRNAVGIPVTVKCRIGVDDQEDEASLFGFVDRVAAAGCDTFIVHARKAWLQGLSPKENRDVPPLNYNLVHRLKAERPDLTISLNGGLADLDAAEPHLAVVDGVMLGRAAYSDPYLLAGVDRRLFGDAAAPPTRHQVIEGLLPHIEKQRRRDVHLNHITRHILGLFQGRPGARRFRRHLSENAHRPGAGPELVAEAAALVPADEQGMFRAA